jgi:hypothetical protein
MHIHGYMRMYRNQTTKPFIELVERLATTGTLLDQHGRGRQKCLKKLREVTDRLQASPRKSLRRLWQGIGVSKSTCQRAAKKAGLRTCLQLSTN